MANTLTNFLVGVGFDFDERSARGADNAVDGLKTRALQAGAAIAGAFGAKALTQGFAQATDRIGKFSQVFGVIPDDVAALGRALTLEGGSLDDFISQVEQLERLRALRPDQLGSLFEQAGIVGADIGPLLNATSATEAYIQLADQFARASQRQRLRLADVFGFDESSIRLLSRGSNGVRELTERYRNTRPITREMTQVSAEFNDELYILGQNIGGVADVISTSLLPGITRTTRSTNDWFDANRDIINQNLPDILKPISDNFEAIGAAGAFMATGGLLSALAGMAKFIPIVGAGLATAAGAAATITGVGAAAAGGYAVGGIISDQLDEAQNEAIGEATARVLAFFGNEEATRALQARGIDTSNLLGEGIASTLAFFGNEEAQRAISINRRQMGGTTPQRPIQVNLTLDGQVIDQRIVDVTDRQNEQAIRDIETSIGG